MRYKTRSIEEHRGNGAVIDTEANSECSLAWQKLYNSIDICPPKLNDVTYPGVKNKETMLRRSLERATHTAKYSIWHEHHEDTDHQNGEYLEYNNCSIVHLKER
jgi:hypothetical protein